MRKRGGKGRIPNSLVAASCAAVLAVYAAGYWRTRDAARQFDAQAKARRAAALTHRATAITPERAMIAPAPAPQPGAAPGADRAVADAAENRSPLISRPKRRHASAAARSGAVGASAAGSSATLAASASTPDPATAAAGIVVAPIPMPPEPTAAGLQAPAAPAAPAAKWRDGTFYGHGDSPHGDINVKVVIKDGRIVEASVDVCNTRYRCELLDPMVDQSVLIQSSDVDYISRATESSDAYRDGLIEALEKALYPSADTKTASQ